MITIKETDAQIEKMVSAALSTQINKRIQKNKGRAVSQLKSYIPSWIMEQPEIESLMSEGIPTSLHSQFNMMKGQGFISAADIASAVTSSVQPNISPVDSSLSGVIEFNVQPANFRNLLQLPFGFSFTNSGEELHWLKWLLTEGNSTIVFGYSYDPSTRSMQGGGSWRIPPQFSGSEDNNFITRALSNRNKELSQVLRELLQ